MQPLGEAAGQSGGVCWLRSINGPVNLTPILECPPPAAAIHRGVSLLLARRRFKKPSASARPPARRQFGERSAFSRYRLQREKERFSFLKEAESLRMKALQHHHPSSV